MLHNPKQSAHPASAFCSASAFPRPWLVAGYSRRVVEGVLTRHGARHTVNGAYSLPGGVVNCVSDLGPDDTGTLFLVLEPCLQSNPKLDRMVLSALNRRMQVVKLELEH